MRKEFTILFCLILLACNQSGKQEKSSVVSNSDQLAQPNTKDIRLDPILEFRQLIKDGKIETAKNFISKSGVNFKDKYGRNFFSIAVRENVELTWYLLDNGYIMNTTEKYQLFEITKSDTSLFSHLYVKHIKDSPTISSAVFHSCDIDLIKYYIRTENPDISLCSYYPPHMSDFHCSCIINHCESNSAEMLNVLLEHSRSNLPQDNSCIIENDLQDYPRLADSLLVSELVRNNLIPETKTWTPLKSYCTWNQNNIVGLLLQNGYDPNWNNSSDLLYYAITRPSDGLGEHLSPELRISTVELLLTYGANPALDISINYDGNNTQMNFNEFAKNWNHEDNTELLKLLDKYTR